MDNVGNNVKDFFRDKGAESNVNLNLGKRDK